MPLRTLLTFLLLASAPSAAEEFAGEVFRIGRSVAVNGVAGVLPSGAYTASQHLSFPSEMADRRIHALEVNALPLFGSLARAYNAAGTISLDSLTQANLFYGIIAEEGILERPLLEGTREERLNDPRLRPDNCEDCGRPLKDMVYAASANFMRRYRLRLPRSRISQRPIPMEFRGGVTVKYFLEELWGDDYAAQNLNLDAGLTVDLQWDYNPVSGESLRNLRFVLGGLELLPTGQVSSFGDTRVRESMRPRWHYAFVWEERFPDLRSRLSVGAQQRSDGGRLPGLGAEWNFREMLYLRTGLDAEFIALGASLAYRNVSVHYAFLHHELATTLYQVSLQLRWP